jgi:glycerol-3-phosphate acyltransferase PlsX
VAVTEGFAGNIALKTAEGTARQLAEYLRSAMARTWTARLGYIFARSAFTLLREKMDPRKVNGGVFLGLNGMVIKSHGGTDAEGFASAVDLAREMAKNDLVRMIAMIGGPGSLARQRYARDGDCRVMIRTSSAAQAGISPRRC